MSAAALRATLPLFDAVAGAPVAGAPGDADPPVAGTVADPVAGGPRDRRWLPERVLVTADALAEPFGRAMVARCEALGVPVEALRGNRLGGLARAGDARATARAAKRTLALVAAPPGQLTLAPIPPSADWQFHLAQGCPAHCQYCYLAGSLPGAPVVRAYANLPAILANLPAYVSGDAARPTSFEASCYTDPLAIEHLTGSLDLTIRWFGTRTDMAGAHLRWTSKFTTPALVAPLLALPHGGRTRVRASVNADGVARRYESATAPVAARLAGLARLAEAGYPVGLVIAPIVLDEGWEPAYARLLDDAAAALPAGCDLTVELITHRFTPGSRDVLRGWYPNSALEMEPAQRTEKRGKFGAVKYVYARDAMRAARAWFARGIAERLPGARILYWT